MKFSTPLRGLVSLLFWISLVLIILVSGYGNPENRSLDTYPKGTAMASIVETPVPASITDIPLPLLSAPLLQASPDPPAPVPTEKYTEIKGKILPGAGFDYSLRRLQISDEVRREIINSFQDTIDFKHLSPGDTFSILLDRNGRLQSCTYEADPLNIYTLTRNQEGLQATRCAISLEQKTVRLTGQIKSSVFNAFTELGEDPKLIHAFADIFASKIDFNTEPRQGDRFEVVVNKYYKDGEFVGYGKILIARYEQQNNILEGFYFNNDQLKGYFDQNGEELGTWFLRSPIPFGRVTSGFTNQRKHPILGTTRPHRGIDFGAPVGTPVMAASDGRVHFIGQNGGFGKQVILSHANGYRTHYGHLSRFGKGLKKGDRVKQKEIIGYVGSTGLSTGPHLDYRIQYNEVFRNPFSLKFKPRSVLKDEDLAAFTMVRNNLARLLDSEGGQKILATQKVTLENKRDISFL